MSATATSRHFRFPWPPSVNRYWRHSSRGTYLTGRAKEYRRECVEATRGGPPITGRVAVSLQLTPPDRRKRDIDNHAKAVLDVLQHALVLEDDEQIDLLRIERLPVESPGCCDVTIQPLDVKEQP